MEAKEVKELVLLVGCPGSGKSTYAQNLPDHVRISQDDQGKVEHMSLFSKAILDNKSVVIDRMNFNREQRERYIKPAKAAGYTVKVVDFSMSYAKAYDRIVRREDHPNISKGDSQVAKA